MVLSFESGAPISIMKKFYRTVAFSLVVPLILLGVLCCHFSGMAQVSPCCSLISSLGHNSQSSSCDTSSKTSKKCTHCDCSKIVGIVDPNYSTSITISKDSFNSGYFVPAFQKEIHFPILRFFNYQSPPKVVQNSLPLQISVRPPPFGIL